MTTQRRRFLRLCGIAGGAVLAGCTGGSGEEATPVTDDQETSPTPPTPDDSVTVSPVDVTQQARLLAEDGDSYDQFGTSVALSADGTTALVGAEMDEDPHRSYAGSTYVFVDAGDTWRQQATPVPDEGEDLGSFGIDVALSSDSPVAVVGAEDDHGPNGRDTGSAYVFTL